VLLRVHLAAWAFEAAGEVFCPYIQHVTELQQPVLVPEPGGSFSLDETQVHTSLCRGNPGPAGAAAYTVIPQVPQLCDTYLSR